MINKGKWLGSLPKNNFHNVEINQLDHDRWINTIPKKNTYNSIKKYSFVVILFVSGLVLVSAVKNETRNLQKEINNLQASVKVLNFNLSQTILDNEVLTSPENISKLAKEHLNADFMPYKKRQIKKFSDEIENFTPIEEKVVKSENKKLKDSIKSQLVKTIYQKKVEIKKLQEMYNNPKSIPSEVKTQIAKKIKEKRIELKNIYESPKNIITLQKAHKWAAIQVVKAFLGIPIIPGR